MQTSRELAYIAFLKHSIAPLSISIYGWMPKVGELGLQT